MTFVNSTAQTAQWNRVIIHDNFNKSSQMSDDIAIIELKQPLNMTVNEEQFVVNTVCLPNQDQTEQSKYGMAAGWGKTSVDENAQGAIMLQEAKFIIINDYQCKTVTYESYTLFTPEEIGLNASLIPSLDELRDFVKDLTLNRLCLMASVPPGLGRKQSRTTILQGDSGSPIIQYYDNHRAHTIGINSFGFFTMNTNPLTLLTKVSSYIDWIRDALKQFEQVQTESEVMIPDQ